MRKQKKLYPYVTTIGATLVIGPIAWVIFKFIPDLFPFFIVWLIIHPVYKIWKELDI